MRERDLLIGTLCLLMMFLFASTSLSRQVGEFPINEGSGLQAGGPKRTATNISSTAIPIVLTAVRNVDTVNWIEEMEFELDNRSDRPVYYVLLVIKFPDLPKETSTDGTPRGLVTTARYGRKDFSVNQRELAREDDVPIPPRGKVVLRLDTEHCEGLRHYLEAHNLPESKIQRLYIRIDELSFGDGSGYTLGSEPFPRRIPGQF